MFTTRFTTREWLTMAVVAYMHLISGMSISIPPPFYPPEAEKRGATTTEYGLVLGICQLSSTFTNPFLGKYIERIGTNVLLQLSMCSVGLCFILLGLVDLVNSHLWFIVLSTMVLMLLTISHEGGGTTCFSITALEFPSSVGVMFATLELFFGLGAAVGPTFGGYLMSVGGFFFMCMMMGGLIITLGTSWFFIVPDFKREAELIEEKPQTQIWSVYKQTPVVLDSLCIITHGTTFGFFMATLESHIRQFHLSPIAVGMVFSIMPVVYTITTPIVGRMCDRNMCPRKIITVSLCLYIFGSSLIGPLPFVPYKTNFWVMCFGLSCYGLGAGAISVAAFIDALRTTIASGLPDDITTYGIVSGIWMASLALGNVMGPAVGGVLYDWVGFRKAILFPISVDVITLVFAICYYCGNKRSSAPRQPITAEDSDTCSSSDREISDTSETAALIRKD